MEGTAIAKSSFYAPTAILFLSELSPNCKQSEIESMFQDFGDVLSVKLHKETLLNYCYVEMENVVEAFRAIDALQGQLYIDLPLSISWSTPFELTPLVAPAHQDSSGKVPMVQVLFSFICHQAQNPVTEDFIASIFNPFGLLVNVSIKRVYISQEKNSQNGYGFVHFCQTWYGVYSAVKCVQWFKKKTVDGVTLDAKFGEQFRRFLHRNQIVSKQDDNFVSPFGCLASLEFEYTALHGIHPHDSSSSLNQQCNNNNTSSHNNSTNHHVHTIMPNLHSNLNTINTNNDNTTMDNTTMDNVQLDMEDMLLSSSSASLSHLAASPRLHQHSLSKSPSSQAQSPLLSLSHPLSPTTASSTTTSTAEALALKKKMALQFYASQLQQLQQQKLQQQQYNKIHSGSSSVVSEDAASFGSNSMSMSSCSASATPQSSYLRMPSSTVAYLQQLHQNMLLQQQIAPSSASVGSNGSDSHPSNSNNYNYANNNYLYPSTTRQVGSPSIPRSSLHSNSNSMLMTAANGFDSNTNNINNNSINNSNNNLSFLQHLRQTPLSYQQQQQQPTSNSLSHTGSSTSILDISSDASTIFSTPTQLGHNLSPHNSRHSISSHDRTLPLHATPSSSTSAAHPTTQGSGKLIASYSSSGHSVVSVGSQGNNSIGSYGSVGQYSMLSGSQPSYSNNTHNPTHNTNNNNYHSHSNSGSFHNHNGNMISNNSSNNNMFSPYSTNGNHSSNKSNHRASTAARSPPTATAARPPQGDYFSKVQQRQAEILELYRQQSQQKKQTFGDL